MFRSQSKYKLFSYSILFEEIVSPFLDLISDFLSIDNSANWGIITAIDFNSINKSLSDEIEKLKNQNKTYEDKIREVDQKKKPIPSELIKKKNEIDEKVETLKFEANKELNKYFFDKIFSSKNLSKYGKKIILIDKANYRIISENENTYDILVKILAKSGLISQLINLSNKNKHFSFDKLLNFDNENLYRSNNVTIEELSTLICPVINLLYLKESITKIPFENSDFWIDRIFFEKYYLSETFAPSQKAYLLKENDKIIGINIDKICFIYESNPMSFIDEKYLLDFHWCLLKNNIYRVIEHQENYKSQLVDAFNNETKKEDFTCLLSNLQKNLYIENTSIPTLYKKYFEEAFNISGLKHLAGYELYLPRNNAPDSSLIGIYHTDKKPSEKHFNLVHWISSHKETNKIYEFSKETPVTKNKNLVYVLKPEISFYFRHKYFEDFFESILKESKLQYISNYKVKYKSDNQESEFDFMIKTDDKIYIIELKTKLRNEEISKYEKKCSRLMKEIPSLYDKVEYVIIGALSDDNCKTYKYYIDEGQKEHPDYNIKREGVFTIPYWFEFPIESSTKKMTCIAEPSYERLKSIINEICK